MRGSAGGARAGGRGREGAAATAPASAPAQWYHVDDGRVKAVDEAAVAGAQAYLLFYSRREGGSSGGGTGGGGGGGVPALDSGGSSSSSPRDAAADAAPVAVRGSAPGAPPAVAWGEGEEVDGSRRPLTARRLRQFRARRRRDPTPTHSARTGHASHASHSTLVSAVSAPAASVSEAPAANALPPPRSASSHGATHSLTRPGRRLGQSLPPRLRQAFSHRRADAASASAAAAGGGGGGGGGGAASEATLLLEEALHEAEMAGLHAAPFDAAAELRDLFAPLDAVAASLAPPAPPAGPSHAAEVAHGGMGHGGMGGGDGCDLSASLPVPLGSDAPLVPARGRSARWRSAGGRRSPLRRMGSARGRREARAAREGREAGDGREGSAGREAREAWNVYTAPRLGRRRPWHKHSRVHSWAPDEAAHSPTRQRCGQVDLASSAPPGGSWPGGGSGERPGARVGATPHVTSTVAYQKCV